MNCKHCGSDDIKRFSVICVEGTSSEIISGTSKPVWNTQPFSPLGKQKISGTRTVKTELAKRCSAPSDPVGIVTYLLAFPAMLFGGYFGFKIGVLLASFWLGIVAFFVALFGVIFGGTLIWKILLGGNKSIQNYYARLNSWKRSWYCSKCGGVTIS